jgi:hypothetical protein
MALVNKSGKIKLLRVNEVGDRFGPAGDFIEAEVIVQLDTHAAAAASGFKLRADANQPVRQGMLDLLRDAFNHGWRVHFDHELPTGKTKGTIVRVWVTKDAVAPQVVDAVTAGGLVFGTVGTTTPATTAGGATTAVVGTSTGRSAPE